MHVPSVNENFVSVSRFARDNNVYFKFHSTVCFVKSQVDNSVLLCGYLGPDGLSQFPLLPLHSQNASPPVSTMSVVHKPPAVSTVPTQFYYVFPLA
ncbi:hypothetical protein VIGAN_03194800 [Vigna angularis var. angularis]|uniref:Uncharacterized protein n=1 Tax=Vigna angularis var. angularis TaxID=157739 RepID=A0A0S3RN56_PHAAN|nr:hypothetical protein VIGAN_03194800 [Vigna angularis var. angularis]